MSSASSTPTRCPNPQCPAPQDVQKVSAVIAAGTTYSTGVYSSGGRSALASRLLEDEPAKPEKPAQVPIPGEYSGYGLILFGAAVLLVGLCSFISLGIVLSQSNDAQTQAGDGTAVAIVVPSLMTLFGGVLLIAGASSRGEGRRLAARERANVRAKQAKLDTEYHEALAHFVWQSANWDKLYYCHRCGSRFVTGYAKFSPPTPIRDVLDQGSIVAVPIILMRAAKNSSS